MTLIVDIDGFEDAFFIDSVICKPTAVIAFAVFTDEAPTILQLKPRDQVSCVPHFTGVMGVIHLKFKCLSRSAF